MITPNIQPNDERITAPARILVMLKRTFEQHSLLNIRIDGFDDAYSSAILKIGKRHDYLLVNALVPIPGNTRLTAGCAIAISTLLDKVHLKFNSSVQKVGSKNNLPFYRIAFPRRVHYAQHRAEYRVAIPMNWRATVSIWLDETIKIDGSVRDLSPSGFSAQFDTTLPAAFKRAPLQLHFALRLAPDCIVEGEVEICHIEETNTGKRRLGIHIAAISPPDKRTLEHCVAEIDRQQSRLR